MAMFKGKDDDTGIAPDGGSNMNTIIGKDTTFSGNLEVSGTLRVDGVVKGEVSVSDTVAVGPTGRVEANVKTKNAVVSGTVKGNIHASERIELQAKANIIGDLMTKSLIIEQGAVFHGNCKMNQNLGQSGVERPVPVKSDSLPVSTAPKAPAFTAEKTR
ncbi:MAG TPA: polymer-forming cytoskeletal protein [candidate division Zixibacteria bacterium]|jgi:cytoskeletal protein CcmA (bactofilin family)